MSESFVTLIMVMMMLAYVCGKAIGNWHYWRWEEKRRKESEARYEQYKKDHPNDWFKGSCIAWPLTHPVIEEKEDDS